MADPDGKLATVRTRTSDGDHRLTVIHQQICRVAARAEYAVIEDLPFNAKSAGVTGMVQGVVRLALRRHNVPYVLVPPATLKKYATGLGNANKADMRVALLEHTGRDVRDDNQVDAAWLRFLGLDLLGYPSLAMPKAHRIALGKVNRTAVLFPARATAGA